MSGKIEPRDGVEVYASDAGFVCIKQINFVQEETIVTVHPDDVPQLIKLIEEAQQEALHIQHDPPGLVPRFNGGKQ
jgi:hypothetical protein